MTPRSLAPALCLSFASGLAVAQCDLHGPDIQVSNITGIADFGPAGGDPALSFGYDLCNPGDTPVEFNALNVRHPIVAANLYRASRVNGAWRFEQVGMGWTFRETIALSNNACCAGCTATNGQTLGVHCSTPTSASLAGSQQGLGPRWEVNPTTGAFPLVRSAPPIVDSGSRRLRVALADMPASGADVRYFAEVHTIAPDDAEQGLGGNNATYRPVSVVAAGASRVLSFAGAAVRGAPGVTAWATLEAGVTQSVVDLPGGGRVLVLSRATEIPDHGWRYEYAVCNINCDRAVGSFAVPVTASVAVSGAGFHDVHYHDGDGPGDVDFSGQDWALVRSGPLLTWSTESAAANDHANAIRWGTTYNFRFDSDAPPGPGVVSLGLWKPGAPEAVSAAAQVPLAPPACDPDYNADGNADQDDAAYLVNVIAGGPNPSGRDPDFTGEGNVDQDDIRVLIGVIAGGPCP